MQKTQDKYGPGIWFMLHLMSAHATTLDLKHAFVQNVTVLGEHFPCENCRHHFSAYVKEHPIKDYIDREKGLFLWVWEFHESVNKRLGKTSMSYDEAWSQFSSTSAICTDDCGEEPSATVISSKTYTIRSYNSFINKK